MADPSQCKDPVCRTIAKALLASSEIDGWFRMWGLHVIAVDTTFEDLIKVPRGKMFVCIKCALSGWVTSDQEDYDNAMIVYNRITKEDEESQMQPPVFIPNRNIS